MMRKNRFVFGAAVFVIALFFAACPGTNSPGPGPETEYTVTAQASDNGSLRFEPGKGPAGTPVKIWADPEEGFKLKELKAGGKAVDISAAEPWEIILTGNVTLTAVFEALPANTYTVTIAALQHGSITAAPKYGKAGDEITLTISPEGGYGLKEGSLTYSLSGSGTPVPITGTSFTLPAGHVTVTAEFETKTAGQLVKAGVEFLAIGNFDAAITAFESAYGKDPSNAEAAIYSSLGALASIAKSQNVRDLVMNRLGFTAYPGTAGSLITGGWLTTYTDERLVDWYYDEDSNKYYEWHDEDDDWFFTYYEITPKTAGYYWYEYLDPPKYRFISGTQEEGPLDGYYDEDDRWVSWYDWNAGNGYQGAGYYYYNVSYTYFFVGDTRKDGPLDYYYDEGLGRSVQWYDWNVGTGYQNPGYYYSYNGTYFFVSDTRKIGPLDSYYDEDLGYWVYWRSSAPSNGTGYQSPGYYYSRASYTYVFVSDTRKIGPLDDYYDEDSGYRVYWRESDPGSGTGYQGPGYYRILYNTYHPAGTTPRYTRRDEKLPGLSVPGWFAETGAYKDSLTTAGGLQAAEWPLLLMANLVEKNQSGLNTLLDDILSSVFGDAFETAAGRVAALSYGDSVQVAEALIAAFGLSEVLEGDDIYVGKAELDILFSSIRLFKAGLEWVAAYNWDTDISFLRTDWKTLEDNLAALSPKNLPFSNNFMKNRNNGMMGESKKDFDKALTDAIAAYTHLISEQSKLPGAYKDILGEYGWIKDGLSKLKSAINNGTAFYVPEEEPSGSTYNNSSAGAVIGINMGNLFTPGQFAIDHLITTESGGASPQFYAFSGDDPVAITGKAQMDSLDGDSFIGFRLNLAPIKEVLVYGDFLPVGSNTLDLPLFPVKIGKDLYGLYHK
jgi:hypothetical protein